MTLLRTLVQLLGSPLAWRCNRVVKLIGWCFYLYLMVVGLCLAIGLYLLASDEDRKGW